LGLTRNEKTYSDLNKNFSGDSCVVGTSAGPGNERKTPVVTVN